MLYNGEGKCSKMNNKLKDSEKIISKLAHDINSSLTVIHLLLGKWDGNLNQQQQEEMPLMIKEIDKIQSTILDFKKKISCYNF